MSIMKLYKFYIIIIRNLLPNILYIPLFYKKNIFECQYIRHVVQ